MQAWILKIIINIAISLLTRKLGSLATAEHVEAAMIKATPLPPDPLPSPKEQRGPIEPHFGG